MQVDSLESSRHLFQPPRYRAGEGMWHSDYEATINQYEGSLTWDPAAILSIVSFGYACGDHTLLKEVKRQPWLSKITEADSIQLESIPSHGRQWQSDEKIANELKNHLLTEAERVCAQRSEIYLLLSGGLDSRVVAGIMAQLVRQGRVATKPVAVTWGFRDSRDVTYAQKVADLLGFEWLHVELSPEDILRGIETTALQLGCLVSPLHLHGMHWFEDVSDQALVLGASYGDMIGRAEFSKKHLLELNLLSPINRFGLLTSEWALNAKPQLESTLVSLHSRAGDKPNHIHCEHEMAAHYMRGLIGHAMSVINHSCTVYQMFTHPDIYSHMWMQHPSRRFDEVYAELLEQLEPRLARLPWARTNRALQGETVGTESGLQTNFHNYYEWVSGCLYDELQRLVDPDWFAQMKIFDHEAISSLCKRIRQRRDDIAYYELFVWLAAFRRHTKWLESLGKSIAVEEDRTADHLNPRLSTVPHTRVSRLRRNLRESELLYNGFKRARRFILRNYARLKYPPLE